MMAGIAAGRLTAQGLSYGDIAVGDWFETDAVAVTERTIDAFAELTGDRFEIHMSTAGAKRHGFQARVAHGLLVLSLVDGLKNQAQAGFRAIASLGWDWSFVTPVLAGDEIRARIVVANKRETRNARRGILTLDFVVTNQRGETVQSGENKLMVYR
ncbi:MaoC family dehydratase N-terminal domain-containing protein [Mesorhizobium sp. AR07]|uniref:MaoC family dehydratase n=1 Tax=Mesorhizobium sp. AR07 TaxID=2865838 RepID=UPI00215FBCCE|nr:MaoC/PaaZ C-terminal domain-containing protein [Mesorhizobium sp. AR07]UVK43896.1 MaoC family dehydratase N-terminal domain-containing protein [Mesorhizobium sp. AR07]